MAVHRRLEVSEVGDVTVVRFVDRKILDEGNIQEVGQELFGLIEDEGRKKLLLNFCNVEFLSSAALGKLINMKKKVGGAGGKMKLCCIHPELKVVFKITRLDQVFEIFDEEQGALDSF